MDHVFESPGLTTSRTKSEAGTKVSGPAFEAYHILRTAFVVAPIVAGLDKFFNLLVNWEQYLPPIANRVVGGYGHEFMLDPA